MEASNKRLSSNNSGPGDVPKMLSNLNVSHVENSNEFKLFENLQKLWSNEKFSRELLSYDEKTINAVISKIEKRVNIF